MIKYRDNWKNGNVANVSIWNFGYNIKQHISAEAIWSFTHYDYAI